MNKEITILLLDDEVIETMWLELKLKRAGFRSILKASCFSEAVQLSSQERPDLAIVDINLGEDKTGIDFVRESDDLKRVFFLSGYRKELYQEDLNEIKYESYLEKPLNINTLLNLL